MQLLVKIKEYSILITLIWFIVGGLQARLLKDSYLTIEIKNKKTKLYSTTLVNKE